jgi:hypothetical protein
MTRGLALSISILCAASAAAGCGEAPILEGRGTLPPPASPPVELGGAPPAHPFALANDRSGAVVRTLLVSEDDPRMRVTARDLGVSPRRTTRPITLAGPAVGEVLGAGGTLRIEKQATPLTSGGWFGVPAQTPFVLVNGGDQPLYVRLYMVEVKP